MHHPRDVRNAKPFDHGGRSRPGRLRNDAQLDADGRLGNPLTGVAPSFTPEVVAALTDDRDVRLAVEVDRHTAERLDDDW